MKTIKIKADVVLVPQKDVIQFGDIASECSGCVFNDTPHMEGCHAANLVADCGVINEDGDNMVFTEDEKGEHWIHLETPSTRKPYKFKAKHAQYLRKDVPNEPI